eukprot:c56248_g1_i1 orf=65-232(-)
MFPQETTSEPILNHFNAGRNQQQIVSTSCDKNKNLSPDSIKQSMLQQSSSLLAMN